MHIKEHDILSAFLFYSDTVRSYSKISSGVNIHSTSKAVTPVVVNGPPQPQVVHVAPFTV